MIIITMMIIDHHYIKALLSSVKCCLAIAQKIQIPDLRFGRGWPSLAMALTSGMSCHCGPSSLLEVS